ncbi:hypothetical protein DPMN_184747 [Dreissena polymorpha]|uniref:Uncharacterized protein n=1 Tax=Dreissena polymorpha TaxID=45954 RepID=A0A9D4DJT7_DREPO|nr:hypothetical protein DPMN_184747 [Dreissena polymorpha]
MGHARAALYFTAQPPVLHLSSQVHSKLYRHRVTSSMLKFSTCNLTFREPLDLEKHRKLHLDRRLIWENSFVAGYSNAENCTQLFEEIVEGSDIPNSHSVVIEENTEDDVELVEIKYIQDGDIITILEGNTSSSLSDIVSKLQYEKICNPTTTYGNQMTSYGYHGNHTTTEVTIDGNQATSECKQENTIGNAAALRTSMVTTTLTHGVIIDNATPENNACDESNGYLDGETLHVSLKVWSSAPVGFKWKSAPPCHSEAPPFPSEIPSCPCIY